MKFFHAAFTFALVYFAVVPSHAQWQVAKHSVPIGQGAGVTGFGGAAPGTSGWVFTSNGPGADPSFQPVVLPPPPFVPAVSTPGGRLCPQMSACIGGIPMVDVPAVATKVIVLLPGTTTWTVPLDWTSSNLITVLGGSGGAAGSAASSNGGASAGSGYSAIANQAFTPGTTVGVNVPAGGAGGAAGANNGVAATDAYFCNSTLNCASIAGTAVIVGAKSGAAGLAAGTSVLGGQASAGVGTTKFSGGNSGVGSGSTGAAGGGGAAGPSGAGGNGANGSGSVGGAGGTGDAGVVAGGAAGAVGNPATIDTDTISMRVAVLLSGAGGSAPGSLTPACAGGFGAGNSSGYGGGMGGSTNGNAGNAGCPGAIVIAYTPAAAVLNYVSCAGYVSGCGGQSVPYYDGSATVSGSFNAGSGGLPLVLNPSIHVAGDCYDFFYYFNSGTPVFGTGPALTNCAAGSETRAATGGIALVPDGGTIGNTTTSMVINNNTSSFVCPQFQCTALGMIHTKAAAQVAVQMTPNSVNGGPDSEVGLDNYFNHISRRIKAQDAVGQYVYNSATSRALNNSTSNTIAVLDGLGVKQLRYGYYTSFASAAAALWAGTNQIAVNQACATGITHGAGFGAFMTQTAGETSPQGGPGITFDAPAPVGGLNRLNPCDGAVNAAIGVFQNDFGQYFIEEEF